MYSYDGRLLSRQQFWNGATYSYDWGPDHNSPDKVVVRLPDQTKRMSVLQVQFPSISRIPVDERRLVMGQSGLWQSLSRDRRLTRPRQALVAYPHAAAH